MSTDILRLGSYCPIIETLILYTRRFEYIIIDLAEIWEYTKFVDSRNHRPLRNRWKGDCYVKKSKSENKVAHHC